MPKNASKRLRIQVTGGNRRKQLQPVDLYQDPKGGCWSITHIALDANQVGELRLKNDGGDINSEVRPIAEVLQPEDDRSVEMHWLQENLNSITALYPGEWIGIDGPELVAHAADLATLLRKSAEAGHPNPLITAIPSEPVISLHV